jgi:hypothetical protein
MALVKKKLQSANPEKPAGWGFWEWAITLLVCFGLVIGFGGM